MTHIYFTDDLGTIVPDVKKSELNGLITKSIKDGATWIDVTVTNSFARVIHGSVFYPKAGVRDMSRTSY